MALPSEADLCRKCGGLLKKGFIEGEAGLSAATILWLPSTPADSIDPDYVGGELAPLGLNRFGTSPKFPARLCPNCKLVEFDLP
jgi:hypothetical protein